jgi:uncharacterized protein YkwD
VARASEGARQFDATLTLTAPGAYQVEVMGDGATGPVIVVNAPIYVGIAEPDDAEGKAPVVRDPPAVEARLSTLINEARARLGLAPLALDAELRGLALAHDEDMVAHHFFGHVSPTTGSFDDRARRANLRVAAAGENVAQAHDADTAYRSLMESPAHRENMVNPRFTHVGIAAVTDGDSGNVDVTLVFARRAPDITSRPTSADLQKRAQAARRAKGLAPVAIDPALQGAAEAGVAALRRAHLPRPPSRRRGRSCGGAPAGTWTRAPSVPSSPSSSSWTTCRIDRSWPAPRCASSGWRWPSSATQARGRCGCCRPTRARAATSEAAQSSPRLTVG